MSIIHSVFIYMKMNHSPSSIHVLREERNQTRRVDLFLFRHGHLLKIDKTPKEHLTELQCNTRVRRMKYKRSGIVFYFAVFSTQIGIYRLLIHITTNYAIRIRLSEIIIRRVVVQSLRHVHVYREKRLYLDNAYTTHLFIYVSLL